MKQEYVRRSAALDLRGGLQGQPLQIGHPTGRSIQQLYDALKNDRAAHRAEHVPTTEDARARQWMISKGIDIENHEREMQDLRAC